MMGILWFNNHYYQKGQTIVEVALALAAAAIIITALLTAVLTSMNGAENSQAESDATQYSQQGMELLRAISQTVTTGTYCLNTDPVNPIQSGSNCTNTPNVPSVNPQYIRTVDIIKPDPDITSCNGLTRVTVITKWRDGQCPSSNLYCKSTQLVSCVSNI